MEKVDHFDFVCEPFHADFTGTLNLSVLGNHFLNCAGQHASRRGFGIAKLHDEDHTWVLSRMVIEFDELPKQYEKFGVDTWIESVYRLFTDRNFAILNSEGKAIGYARTVWAMIGLQSRKPVDLMSLADGEFASFANPEKSCPIEKPSRIKVSSKEPVASFTARYSDIDINGHVNSMRYIEHAMDLFSLDYLREHRIRRFEIAYVTESYYGDRINIYADQENGVSQIEMRKAEDNTVLCRIKII